MLMSHRYNSSKYCVSDWWLCSLQVYISACLSGINRRPSHSLSLSQSCDRNYETTSNLLRSTSRQRSVPAVLNELSMDSRLIQFLETKGHKSVGAMIVKIPTDQMLNDQSHHAQSACDETNFIDMLTQKLAENANLGNKGTDILNSSVGFTGNDPTGGNIQRRLDRVDILSSPRFHQRRYALANIMNDIDVRQLKKQLSVPTELESFLQLAIPEVTTKNITQMDAPLAFWLNTSI